MIILLFILSIALTAIFFYLDENCSSAEIFGFIGVLTGCIVLVSSIATIVLICTVSNSVTIEQKIALYEEENAVIESQIATVVESYMDYEKTTFKDCSAESMITLVDLYPELKADTLVSKQIEVYLKNNDKIKDLKESLINRPVYRWWLYFGK